MTQQTAKCDERGRLLLPLSLRKDLGKEFHIVKATHEIILIPVSVDPIRELAQIGKIAGLSKIPISKIKEEIRKQAMSEL